MILLSTLLFLPPLKIIFLHWPWKHKPTVPVQIPIMTQEKKFLLHSVLLNWQGDCSEEFPASTCPMGKSVELFYVFTNFWYGRTKCTMNNVTAGQVALDLYEKTHWASHEEPALPPPSKNHCSAKVPTLFLLESRAWLLSIMDCDQYL